MNTNFTLKNFRVFDSKNGGTFKLSPITVLTGCNSSGKSSVVKALLLLRDLFKDLETKNVSKCKLNFANQAAKLGSFDIARNKHSKKGSKISFAYTTYSNALCEDLLVELTFSANSKDCINNGWLEGIVVRKASNKRVIMDISYDYAHPETHGTVLTVNKIDLSTIVNSFFKSAYGCTMMRIANTTNPTGKNFTYTADDCKELNCLLDAYNSYASKDETDSMQRQIVRVMGQNIEEYDSLYDKYDTTLYKEASHQGVMFPLPILPLLKGIKKGEVRSVLSKYITEIETKQNREFPYRQLVDNIITAFEESKYSNFIAYYKAKEREALCFRDVKHGLDGDSWVTDNNKADFFSDTIKSYSTLVNIDSCVVGCYGIDSRQHKSHAINPTEFLTIYNVLVELCKYNNYSELLEFVSEHRKLFTNVFGDFEYTEHKVFSDLCEYFDNIISLALSPANYKNFQYIGDSDIEVKRIYNTEYGGTMSALLSKYLDACSTIGPEVGNDRLSISYYIPGTFINKWIKAFGIGDRVSIELAGDGAGIQMRLFKDEKDKRGTLLADEGFGVTKFIAMLINIEYYKITGSKMLTLAIEEPENHLHPKYQSLLAEMFVDAYKEYGIHFIIETHSEYLIRKLQTLIAKEVINPEEVSLQYVYNANPESRPKSEPHVKHIPINEDGTLQDTFGSGFLDEADNLAMDILIIKATK